MADARILDAAHHGDLKSLRGKLVFSLFLLFVLFVDLQNGYLVLQKLHRELATSRSSAENVRCLIKIRKGGEPYILRLNLDGLRYASS